MENQNEIDEGNEQRNEMSAKKEKRKDRNLELN